MIDTLKQYKAFGKFVEWIREEEIITVETLDCNFLEWHYSDRELLSLLVEFCDSRGYYISTHPLSIIFSVSETKYSTITRWEGEITFNFDTRTEATKQAIKKCFELMEKEQPLV